MSAATALVFAVLVPLSGAAIATHGARTLEVTPETAQNAVDSGTHTLTATLSLPVGAEAVAIDFEVESGPADPDAASSPTTPDFTCTIVVGSTCTVDIGPGAAAGDTVVRAWIDHDGLNTTVEADATEAQDEATTPGADAEPDLTDVVSKTWFTGLPAGAVLDCVQEDEDPSDVAINPIDDPADSETYTCTLLTSDATPAPIPNVTIDVENLAGSNDPDDDDTAGTADVDDACTTDAAGTCTVTVEADESEVGTALFCFWADADADDEFDPGGIDDDGGDCAEAVGAADDDQTDVVSKEWQTRALDSIDATPDFDVNETGTSHTVTITTLDQFGDPIGGVNFDVVVTGVNAAAADNRVTNAQGTNDFTYTDTGGPGDDTIDVFVDEDDDDVADDPALTDTVFKTWIDEPAVAADVEIDMEGCDGDVTDLSDASWDEEAAPGNVVGGTHTVCATAVTAGGQVLWGHEITFTSADAGGFVDPDTGEEVTTVTVPIDGTTDYAEVELSSTTSGTQTVTVTIDGQTDTGTKEWSPGNARILDLEPETATNDPGTIHTVTATVTDAFGNGVPGVEVTFGETGVGAFRDGSSSVTAVTDANGVATAETTTLASELGQQTITAAIDSGVAGIDCELEADDPNPGDPEGVCTDDVLKIWGPTCPGFAGDPRNQIVGTPGRDTIRGTTGDDIICGLGGRDVLRGSEGNDLIKGGRGNDTMKGGDGDDRLVGGRGPDRAYGNNGTDVCRSAKVQKGCEN